MTAQATGLGKALRLTALFLAGFASTSVHAQGMVGTAPVKSTKSTTPTGVPTIAGNPSRMLVAGTFYDFRPTAADPNGDPLTFSDQQAPALGDVRPEHRPPARHAGRQRRRQDQGRPDFRQRRHEQEVARQVQHQGRRGQAADDLGRAGHGRHRGPGLRVPADRGRQRPADAALRHHQQADLGDVRRRDGPPVRHAAEGQRGRIRQRRNLRDRRREHRQPRCRSRSPSPQPPTQRRRSWARRRARSRSGRSTTSSRPPPTPTATRCASRSSTRRRGRASTPRPAA